MQCSFELSKFSFGGLTQLVRDISVKFCIFGLKLLTGYKLKMILKIETHPRKHNLTHEIELVEEKK